MRRHLERSSEYGIIYMVLLQLNSCGAISESEIPMKTRVVFSVAKGVGANKVEIANDLVHDLDFSNCSDEELLDLASKPIIIKLQGIYRELQVSEVEETHFSTIDVHELINRPVTRQVDPVKGLLNKVDKGELSGEELEALIEKLQAKIN